MACSLLEYVRMTVTRIVQLVDGEEMISYEGGEPLRTSLSLDDPRHGALERRGLANATQRHEARGARPTRAR